MLQWNQKQSMMNKYMEQINTSLELHIVCLTCSSFLGTLNSVMFFPFMVEAHLYLWKLISRLVASLWNELL